MIGDRRAVSTPVSYTLTLIIALTLVSGLLIGGTTLVDDQRNRTMQSQLATIGQQVAGSFEAVDRSVTAADSGPAYANVTRDVPQQIMGTGYAVAVYSEDAATGTPPRVRIHSTRGNVSVTLEMDLETSLAEDSRQVPSGPIEIGYVPSDGLVINRA